MAIAYGSITLVDIGDLGQLSVIPESNQPTMVIYDPDTSIYNPNWAESNLKLTPVVYYAGKQVSLTNNNLSINWKLKIGSGEANNISTGISNGILTVNNNPFEAGNITLLTYIVTASYSEPNMGTTLTATGQITFGLIQNASKVKTIGITGESAFLYKSDGTVVKNNITLTATAKNTSIAKWQYLNSNDTFVDINNTATTLNISSDSAYFNDDIAVIRVVATDDNLYDEHTILKIRDGAHGTSTVSVVLSNDDQMLAADSNGKVTSSLDEAQTTITIYSGNTDVTDKYSITANPPDGITGTLSGNVYAVTGVTDDFEVGSVSFTCTPKTGSGYTETFIKKFTLTKVKTGADGTSPTIYTLSVDSLAINKNIDGVYTPNIINISAFSQTGNAEKVPYKGRFGIYVDGASTGTLSTSDESTKSYTISNAQEKIVVKLFKAGGTSTLLDTQTIVITSDGKNGNNGDPGPQGEAALNFVLGNYSDTIPCLNNGNVAVVTDIIIPFSAYKGINKVACTAVYSALPSGMSLVSNTNGTAAADGQLHFEIDSGANLGSIDSGTITITLTAEGKSSKQTYTWTKNKQAKDGTSAVIFQIYAPNGNIISNNENNVLLETSLIDGSSEATAITYKWYRFIGNDYALINGAISKNYTVSATEVESYNSYKCIATYNGKDYTAYLSVYDRTDPLQINVYSTLGDKILNSQGVGIVYALVHRNGEEIDVIKTISNGTQYPSNPSNGNYFWLLNSTNKTATLMKYNGSSWSAANDQTGTYTWTLRNIENETVKTLTGKAIYIDADVIDKKMTFDVKVEI